MFQSFTETASPEQGPPRLQLLREAMAQHGVQGFLIPRADAHQGEYVARRDDRLAWLTGFTGSAGFCIALTDRAGVFVDGRYRVQVKTQVETAHFTCVDWPETKPADWLKDALPNGGVIGFDPWLYTPEQIEALETGLAGSSITLRAMANLIDQIWADQPGPPNGVITAYPAELAGRTHAQKRAELARSLDDAGEAAAVITLPDSIAWLLNIRGSDIPRNPVPHCFAVLFSDGRVTLYLDPDKMSDPLRAHLGEEVLLRPSAAFAPGLESLQGTIRLDKSSVPVWVADTLRQANIDISWGTDPCVLPKACKTEAEIASTRAAHIRDGAAVCEFLAWFDEQAAGTISEIDVVRQLEEARRATGKLLDISFDTIAGSGPHGALAHYRVTNSTNRILQSGDLLVLDSGGQYLDGTTDITRTLPIGPVGDEEATAFTRVLQGMIAMSRVRFPRGLAGRDLDALARYPLWLADQDYGHGTGHGVGVHLCVHEGPQRLSRASTQELLPGMILSNEPGYYREGAFGIRIENLLVVQPATPLPDGDSGDRLCFETINFVPINQALIKREMLSAAEADWLNSYHATCREKLAGLLSETAQDWLQKATTQI